MQHILHTFVEMVKNLQIEVFSLYKTLCIPLLKFLLIDNSNQTELD